MDTQQQVKALIISSHPNAKSSIINKAIVQEIQLIDHIIHRNLESIYPDKSQGIDIEVERNFYCGVQHIVFVFPLHYFNITPMLKTYMNQVWYPWANENLKGKNLHLIVTAGAPKQAFTSHGVIHMSIKQIFAPMQACANLLQMHLSEPLCFYDVLRADRQQIEQFCNEVKHKIKTLD